MAKKTYIIPGKAPDLGRKARKVTDLIEKKNRTDQLSIRNLRLKEVETLDVYARIKAKVAYLNKMLRKKEPSDIAQIIHYWVKQES